MMLMMGAIVVVAALIMLVNNSKKIKVTVRFCLNECLLAYRLKTPSLRLELQNSGINLSSMAS